WDPAAGAPRRLGAPQRAGIEARALPGELRALHDPGGIAREEGGVPLRSRGDPDLYPQALRDAGGPHPLAGGPRYFQRREILEAASLVRAVADPNDPLALLAALRSSLAGVPDAALLALWRAELPARAARLVDPCAQELAALRATLAEVAAELPRDV